MMSSTNTTATDPAMLAYLEAMGKIYATQDLSEDRQDYLRNLSIAFVVLAVFFIILRFLARAKTPRKYGWDDWTILVSLVFVFGNLTCMILSKSGSRFHTYHEADFNSGGKWAWFAFWCTEYGRTNKLSKGSCKRCQFCVTRAHT